jgi:hypothetical protein
MPVILGTQKVEIERIEVQSQHRQKVPKTPSQQVKAGHGRQVPIIPATQEV